MLLIAAQQLFNELSLYIGWLNIIHAVAYHSDDFGGEEQHEEIDGSNGTPRVAPERAVNSGQSSWRELDSLCSRRQVVSPERNHHPRHLVLRVKPA